MTEAKNNHVNPVQWTEDGYPVFTDPAQFQKWEEQYRQNLVEEISDVLNVEAVKIAALAVESREAFIVEEIKRLTEQIERIEIKTIDALGVVEKKYDNDLQKIDSEMRTFKLRLKRVNVRKG